MFIKDLIRKLKKLLNKKLIGGSICFSLIVYFYYKNMRDPFFRVKLSQFVQALSMNVIKDVMVYGNQIIFKVKNDDQIYNADISMLTKDRLFQLLQQNDEITYECQGEVDVKEQVSQILTSFMMSIIGYQIYQMYNWNGNKSVKFDLKQQYFFKDVYGNDYAKQELMEIVKYLKNPTIYKNIGARLRRGILLYGPPGTGKTLLARATAGESQVNFIHCAASEFVELYVGSGALKVRRLFEQARNNQPCLIFIDEIDSVGLKINRNADQPENQTQERDTTLNQLLTEMDGFQENENIVVIAATNRLKMLDSALTRSGRFDVKIKIDMPNQEERQGIIQLHLQKKKQKVTQEIISQVAQNSNNLSGADLESMVNESAYFAIRQNQEYIQNQQLINAFQKIAQMKQ